MFQLVIGGHDYADIAHLEWSNIRRGRIRFQRYKNRNHPGGGPIIDNLLCPFAVATMEKYGDKSSKRIFGFIPIDSRYTHHRGNVNRSLSTITKSVGLKVKLTSKTPRYLFRTYAGELGVDTLTIMQLQGHTPQGVTFGYQRSLPYKIIDQGLGKVLDKLFSS